MDGDRVEVRPYEDGSWGWQRFAGGESEGEQGLATRREAIDAARAARDGARVLLLRVDGTLHGELTPADRRTAAAQTVDLDPASENGAAGL